MRMGYASRANTVQRDRAFRRLVVLKVRVQRGTLTTDDIRFLTQCGPNVRAYVGYAPQVALYQPKVTLA